MRMLDTRATGGDTKTTAKRAAQWLATTLNLGLLEMRAAATEQTQFGLHGAGLHLSTKRDDTEPAVEEETPEVAAVDGGSTPGPSAVSEPTPSALAAASEPGRGDGPPGDPTAVSAAAPSALAAASPAPANTPAPALPFQVPGATIEADEKAVKVEVTAMDLSKNPIFTGAEAALARKQEQLAKMVATTAPALPDEVDLDFKLPESLSGIPEARGIFYELAGMTLLRYKLFGKKCFVETSLIPKINCLLDFIIEPALIEFFMLIMGK